MDGRYDEIKTMADGAWGITSELYRMNGNRRISDAVIIVVDALLVEDVGKISHDYSTALRVLEFLQDHGAVLICTQCDVSYVLYIKGLSQALHQRAVRKGLGLPWWTGGERYTEINRAAGND